MFYILDYFLIFSFSGVWHACLGLGRNLSDGPILFVHHHHDDAVCCANQVHDLKWSLFIMLAMETTVDDD